VLLSQFAGLVIGVSLDEQDGIPARFVSRFL